VTSFRAKILSRRLHHHAGRILPGHSFCIIPIALSGGDHQAAPKNGVPCTAGAHKSQLGPMSNIRYFTCVNACLFPAILRERPAKPLATDQQRRVRELFDAALDQPSERRQSFLIAACAGDQKLLETVGRLLLANERSAGVLDTPVWKRRDFTASPIEPGAYLGPYRILRDLGAGGMGIVYQAVRADEVFQRICAVKVIRPELCSEWLLERFRAERKILGRLDHTNIARIVDGGSTPEGLPYFVMDYVDGPSLIKFCAEHDLSAKPRLALFQQVCGAVHYLHENGVIHGDLKPPNILVGHDGVIKLVDFGIASLLSSSDSQTQDRVPPLLTPRYASPEQIAAKQLTPASEVYSLGVILYELLAGTQPLPSISSMSQMLGSSTTEPAPPSSSGQPAGSAFPYQALNAYSSRGDLECVVLRAMHRSPELRYQSVAELNADISRYLQNRPVLARKGSLLYRGRKFFVRHQYAALAALLIFSLLSTVSWEGFELHKRYERSKLLEDQVRELQHKLADVQNTRKAGAAHPSPSGSTASDSPPLLNRLQESQMQDVSHLADAYRTSFPEAVRLWPGMTTQRRNLLDNAERYLRDAEPFIGKDPQSREQLARAWLWLADLQGNPQTINLHDRAGASSSIQEAQQILRESQGTSPQLLEQIRTAAGQIEASRK
jgi:eukaryotic-like serine/threonine-protein kinase